MFNKKLISTVLSALTLFPTAAPLVSANGSQADEQPQPSNTAPASAPEATDTAAIPPAQKRPHQTESQADAQPQPSSTAPASAPEATDTAAILPAQKRPRQAEPQTDTAAKSDKIDFHLKEAHACLNAVENFKTKFMAEVEKDPQYLHTNFFSYNNNSEFMDELYAKLGELIIHLDVLYNNATFSLKEVDTLRRTVDLKLKDLQITILNVLKNELNSPTYAYESYKKIQNETLGEIDLYNPDSYSTATLRNILTKIPRNIQYIHTLFLLYKHFVVNVTMHNIRTYLLYRGWTADKPIDLNPESATNHLKESLSTYLKQNISPMVCNVAFNTSPYVFSRIVNINKILSLEIFNTNFDIHLNVLLDYLDIFENNIKLSRPVTTNPICIINHLSNIYYFSPQYPERIAPNHPGTMKLKSKLREVNTLLFKKIEEMNFEKFPELQEILKNILGPKNSLFDPTLSPIEYYNRFTKKIIEYLGTAHNSSLHVRLYKLSVLANIMIGIQDEPYEIPSVFDYLEQKTEEDILRMSTQPSNACPEPEPQSESESEPEEEKLPPFKLEEGYLFSIQLLALNFFNDLVVQLTPPKN